MCVVYIKKGVRGQHRGPLSKDKYTCSVAPGMILKARSWHCASVHSWHFLWFQTASQPSQTVSDSSRRSRVAGKQDLTCSLLSSRSFRWNIEKICSKQKCSETSQQGRKEGRGWRGEEEEEGVQGRVAKDAEGEGGKEVYGGGSGWRRYQQKVETIKDKSTKSDRSINGG